MKRIILLCLLIFSICSCTISPIYTDSYYQRERYYDDSGHYKGYSQQRQNSDRIRYYDEKSHYQGYAIKSKYGTRYYNAKGRYIGNSK